MSELLSHVFAWIVVGGILLAGLGIGLSWLYLCTRVIKYAWGS
jgi:hypothetical protein